ncbi:MAG: hypothetical protein RJA61_434, partial [Candidatus Parcubacteria bacterium]
MILKPNSKNSYVLGGIFLILIVVGVLLFVKNKEIKLPEKEIQTPASYKDATYKIDGVLVSLTDGVSEISVEGSSSK